jgi:hypothetical protein
VETSLASKQVLDAIHRFTEMRHGLLENGGAQGHLQQRPVEAILDVREPAVVSVTSSIQMCGFRRNTIATGECPIMNNFLSHVETVWVA